MAELPIIILLCQGFLVCLQNKQTINIYYHKMRKSSFLISVAAVMALATPACAASVKVAKGNTKQMAKHMALQREVGLRSITEDAARAHVYFLADDLLEGRRAGDRGSRIAKQYIISQMRQLGLKPMLGNSYEQPFEACGVQRLKRGARFLLKPIR